MKLSARAIALLALIAAVCALIYYAGGVFGTILLASVVAYALHPMVSRLERLRIPRPLGILVVLLVLIILAGATLALSLPELGRQIDHFAQKWPGYVESVRQWFAPFIQFAEQRYPDKVEEFRQRAVVAAQDFLPTALRALGTALKGAATGVAGFMAWLINALMVPVLAYFLLANPGELADLAKRLIPDRAYGVILPYARQVDDVLRAWLRGQLTVAIALAIIYAIGLTLVQVPLGMLIGIVGGLANLIPYMGLVLGLLPAMLLAVLDSGHWVTPALAAGVFILGQMLEGTVITPRVMGSGLGLPPALVLVAVLAGGQMFGVIGLLLAVPATAAAVVILASLKRDRAAGSPGPTRPRRPLRRRRPI